MSLPDDLIEQAEHLARREPRRPRQASLRRSVSTAYYALFHLLAADGAAILVPDNPEGLRVQAQRAFAHGEMKRTCEQFTRPTDVFDHLLVAPLEAELHNVARTFVDLQLERHSADYDLARSFDRVRVLSIVRRAKVAMLDWKKVRKTPNANVFLTALLLGGRWNR